MSDNTPVEKVVDSNLDDEVSGNATSEQHLESTLEKTLMKEEKSSVKRKIDILLKATGDAPIIKSKKWAVECDRSVGSVIVFLKRYLKLDATESIYLYVNQCFAPSPDQLILNLYECFGSDGKLVLHYCKTPAWG